MAAECATTAITRMARLLEVSTSGYYKRANRSGTTELTDREQRKADLTVKIIDHHRDSGGVYGSPRITADLRAAGERVSEKTVATIMSEIGLAGISLRPRDPGTPQGRWCRRTLMPAGVDRWVQPGSVGTRAWLHSAPPVVGWVRTRFSEPRLPQLVGIRGPSDRRLRW
jgi:HTH-like domain